MVKTCDWLFDWKIYLSFKWSSLQQPVLFEVWNTSYRTNLLSSDDWWNSFHRLKDNNYGLWCIFSIPNFEKCTGKNRKSEFSSNTVTASVAIQIRRWHQSTATLRVDEPGIMIDSFFSTDVCKIIDRYGAVLPQSHESTPHSRVYHEMRSSWLIFHLFIQPTRHCCIYWTRTTNAASSNQCYHIPISKFPFKISLPLHKLKLF